MAIMSDRVTRNVNNLNFTTDDASPLGPPLVGLNNTCGNSGDADLNVSLYRNPLCLHIFWYEYEFGITR